MTEPLVSILLPVYNAAGTLAECLDSLRAQTLHRFEVVIVDDGSTDDSAAICTSVVMSDPRFRLHRRPHGGIVEALIFAAREAAAPKLARMDADDIALPERLASQLQYLDEHPDCGLVGSRVASFGESLGPGRLRYDGWINGLVAPEALERELLVECPIPHPTFMMPRGAYDAIGGYRDVDAPEDYDLVLRLVRAGWKLGKIDRILLRWRHTDDRLSHTSPMYAPERFRALKRTHLLEGPLNNGRTFYQWGAGEVGKDWLREWGERRPKGVVEVNPRKIGRRIHDVPVIAPHDLPPPGVALTVVTVGAPGARADIRAWFRPRGYVERRDFVFLA